MISCDSAHGLSCSGFNIPAAGRISTLCKLRRFRQTDRHKSEPNLMFRNGVKKELWFMFSSGTKGICLVVYFMTDPPKDKEKTCWIVICFYCSYIHELSFGYFGIWSQTASDWCHFQDVKGEIVITNLGSEVIPSLCQGPKWFLMPTCRIAVMIGSNCCERRRLCSLCFLTKLLEHRCHNTCKHDCTYTAHGVKLRFSHMNVLNHKLVCFLLLTNEVVHFSSVYLLYLKRPLYLQRKKGNIKQIVFFVLW